MSSSPYKNASRSALWLGILTIAAMLTGVLLIATLGGSSGRDLGSAASGAMLKRGSLLIVVAELLKLALAICQAALTHKARQVAGNWQVLAFLSGYAAAVLIGASGVVGIYAVFAESRGLGSWASALAFGSAGATGIWVLTFLSGCRITMKRWLRIVGYAFAAVGLVSLALAPLAMLAGLLGIAWWLGLWRALGAAPAQA